MKKLLPLGVQSFENIRETGKSIYVDKTKYIYQLIQETEKPKIFFSRPRRFGKSLFIDTIRCLFEGKKELFEGLFIYDKWDWNTKYPVIKIVFGDEFISNTTILYYIKGKNKLIIEFISS